MIRRLRAVDWALSAVLSVALMTRGAYLAVLRGEPLRSDALQYSELAQAIRAGKGFAMVWPQVDMHATAFRPPLYPFVLAQWQRVVGDSVFASRSLNVVLGLIVILLAFRLVTESFGRGAGLVCAAVLACYPQVIANDVSCLAEPLSMLLFVAGAWCVSKRQWFAFGLCLGAQMLTKPSAQGIVLIGIAVALASHRVDKRGALRSVGVLLVGVVVLVAPWSIRNHRAVGTWALVTSNGFNAAAVYSPAAQSAGTFVDPVFHDAFQSTEERLWRFDEQAWSDHLWKLGTDGLRDNPSYALRVIGRNAGAMFEITPGMNDSAEVLDGRDLNIRRWSLPLFYLVTILGFSGVAWAFRRHVAPMWLVLLVGVAGYQIAVSLPFLGVPRLRSAVDLLAAIGVGIAAGRVVFFRQIPVSGIPQKTV